jgi:hypothetical protein
MSPTFSRLRRFVRPALAAVVALSTILVLVIWTFIGEAFLRGNAYMYGFSNLRFGPERSPDAGTEFTTGEQQESLVNYYLAITGSLWLAGGLTAALIVLKGGLAYKVRLLVYLAFLLVLVPASSYNFAHADGDVALRAPYQAGLNVMMVFLGLSVCWGLREWKAEAPDARILKMMVFTFLLFSAVLIPGLLTMLWGLWKINVLPRNAVDSITIPALTGFAGVVSAAVTVIKYIDEKRKPTDPAPPAPTPVAATPQPRSRRRRRR